MNLFPDISTWSLRKKLVSIIMLGSSVCLLRSLLVLAGSSLSSFHRNSLKQLTGLANVLAANGQAAIIFSDKQEAQRLLDSLQDQPEISSAWLITTDGTTLSQWSRKPGKHAIPADYQVKTTLTHSNFWSRRADLYHPVVRDGERIGYILLQADFTAQWHTELSNFFMALFMAALALFVVFLLATRLQRVISRPIAEIADTARFIARNKSYELRIAKRTDDEIGDLVIAFNHMLSEIQERDEHLIHHQDQLEDEVTKRTTELLHLKDEAESASHFKGVFLSNMSHEIRTPMNAIIGLSDLALSQQLTPKLRDYLSKIHSSSLTLLALTNDILDYSKVEAGRLELSMETFNLTEVLDNAYNLFIEHAKKKGLRVTLELDSTIPHSLIGDPLRLGQIFNNLLGNAVKFTPTGEINIQVHQISIEQDASTLHFSVQDTGIGMTTDQASHLFQAFTQADGSISRRFGGTGLGLAISKQLVEIMGGEIQLKSEPDVGSTFSFTLCLPFSTEAVLLTEKHGASILELSSRLRGAQVLLVDDNEINRLVAREFLENAGLQVSEANNGQEAVESVVNGQFDAVLMDIQMAVMGGFEATRLMRSHAQFHDLPIIAMTAAVLEEDKNACFAAGMSDHIAKPILPLALLETLSKWIKHDEQRASPDMLAVVTNATTSVELPGFDFAPVLTLFNGNTAQLKKLLRQFSHKFATASPEIIELVKTNNTAEAATLVHNIIGASGNLGAVDLYHISLRLEKELTSNSPITSMAQFNATITSAFQAIDALTITDDIFGKSSISMCEKCAANAAGTFVKLRALLEGNDYIPHELMEELKTSLPCRSIQQDLQKIEKFVSDFKYEQAITLIERLNCTVENNLPCPEIL